MCIRSMRSRLLVLWPGELWSLMLRCHICVCVCVCVFLAFARSISIFLHHIYMYVYVYIYIHIYIYVCMYRVKVYPIYTSSDPPFFGPAEIRPLAPPKSTRGRWID